MMQSFTKILINWYKENKRDLPWRNNKDPYHIWLSEIILQQTRVEQGMPYYLKFIKHFPTIKHLAEAPVDDVMNLWQGLGYYSRCRNLHETAKKIWFELNGEFPENFSELIQLKGIGPYTAAAISSICFKKPQAVVDGNVDRFLSRLFSVQLPVNSTAGKKTIYELANHYIDKDQPGNYNQAMMEFGATICRPINPICETCIFRDQCRALKNGLVNELPMKTKKRKPVPRYFDYLVICCTDEIFLQKRNEEDIWKGLYEFLLIERNSRNAEHDISKFISQGYSVIGEQVELNHKLTHRIIHSRFKLVSINSKDQVKAMGTWVHYPDLSKYPVSRLTDKYINDHLAEIVEYSHK